MDKQPEAPAQPAATQPGMDVVAPPPADPPADSEQSVKPDDIKQQPKKDKPAKVTKPKSQGSGITGTIIVTTVVLAILSALAVMAYLDS